MEEWGLNDMQKCFVAFSDSVETWRIVIFLSAFCKEISGYF